MACAFDCIDERPRTDIFTGVLASTALKGGDTLPSKYLSGVGKQGYIDLRCNKARCLEPQEAFLTGWALHSASRKSDSAMHNIELRPFSTRPTNESV